MTSILFTSVRVFDGVNEVLSAPSDVLAVSYTHLTLPTSDLV